MFTFLLMFAFGVVGSVIGEHWCDGLAVEGAIIGAVVGIIVRILFFTASRGSCSGGGFDFPDFGGFDGGD